MASRTCTAEALRSKSYRILFLISRSSIHLHADCQCRLSLLTVGLYRSRCTVGKTRCFPTFLGSFISSLSSPWTSLPVRTIVQYFSTSVLAPASDNKQFYRPHCLRTRFHRISRCKSGSTPEPAIGECEEQTYAAGS
ncbi:hypothetical protein BDN72DRAFT_381530 [Pluteus cervinus]|uniref:Uncharacterized protein n=1 Tax=Pluteus cervinus TaxID=181527 RepID=A0ACD3B2V7_9AGAR|nr:hypothetical protein BDN72DRAFT_381530 [Pluteus cervinus]